MSASVRDAPLLVFLDDEPWHSLFDLAALVRRKGCRTVRITTARPRRHSSWLRRAAFDRTVVLGTWEDAPPLDLLGGRVVDVIAPETLARTALGLVRGSRRATARALDTVARRDAFADKLRTAEALRSHGIAVPPTLRAGETTPREAVGTFGLPLVLKPSVGAAGAGVVVATSERELEEACERLSGRGELFYEKLVVGDQYAVAAAFASGVVLQRAAQLHLQDGEAWRGPSAASLTVEDPRAAALVQQVTSIVGGSGLLALDVIRDRDGVDWVIDVNLRAWHSLGALLSAGIDFSEGYLYALGVRRDPPRVQAARPGRYLEIYLSPRRRHPSGRAGSGPVGFLRESVRRARRLGARYVLAEDWSRIAQRLGRSRPAAVLRR